MKLQLDTEAKTIKVEESVNLGELIETLDRLLPNDTWKGFKLETNTTIKWSSPIIIEKYPTVYPYYPVYPWWHEPIVYYKTGYFGDTTGLVGSTNALVGHTQQNTLVGGTYDIEIQ